MQEIEVKFRVADSAALASRLAERGIVFGAPITQRDAVFENMPRTNPLPPERAVLRIRQQGDTVIFTLKKDLTSELVNLEHEVTVNDAAELEAIIRALGFYGDLRVSKVRRKAKHERFELCLDEVESLGSFLEIELLSEEEDLDAARRELLDFAAKLGLKPEDEETRGYDSLIRAKQLS